jgi:alpha-beta hydrolase superfamily lysophospholipase
MHALTYEATLVQLAQIATAEATTALNPLCRSFALTHGRRSERCVLLLHGYTNCPQQFRRFAEQLHERGHSVYVPRLPRHGLADRLTKELADLSRAELLFTLDAGLAIAHGLGERVDVLGLSAGANMAAYAAQYRADVHLAVVIAPVLGTPAVAAWATPALALAAAVIPNQFHWWDPALRNLRRGVPHAYPRYATRSLGVVVRMGLEVLAAAQAKPPHAREILLVANAADAAVTLPPIERLAACWRAHGATVREHCFAAELKLIHDIIDPSQEDQRVEYTYPLLLELIGCGGGASVV